jgi:hypothetical protein
MNTIIQICGVVVIVTYLQFAYWASGKIWDAYHDRKNQSWWTLFFIWPCATISQRRNLPNKDWRWERLPYEDCYACLIPNRTTREYYVSIMTFFLIVKIVWNLIVILFVAGMLAIMPIGAILALGIAIPLSKVIHEVPRGT